MIPLGDVGPRLHRRAQLTWALVLLNVLVYAITLGGDFQAILLQYGLVPGNLSGERPAKWVEWRVDGVMPLSGRIIRSERRYLDLDPDFDLMNPEVQDEVREHIARTQLVSPRAVQLLRELRPRLPSVFTLFSSMFLHGGLMHLLGNLVFLAVFGRRLEDRLGRGRFLAFYLLTGTLAGLGHAFSDPGSTVPTVGASGAIAGVLGGYVLLWPKGRILTLIPLFVFIQFLEIPALVFIGVWVAKEVLRLGNPGNVAVWAHLVGFLYGMVIVRFLDPRDGGGGMPFGSGPRGPVRDRRLRPWRGDDRPWR